jgi:hypothetical protein
VTNDYLFIAKLRIVSHFHCRIEGIHVNMQNVAAAIIPAKADIG